MSTFRVDMSREAVTARLQHASKELDLRPERRLDTKIDLSAAAVTSRLEEASDLLDLCLTLGRGGRRVS